MGFKSAAIIAGVAAACASALAPQTHAREPDTAVAALQNPAGPAAEPANTARRRRPLKAARKHASGAASIARQESDGYTEVTPHFSESIGWRLTEDRMTGARLGLPEKLVPRTSTTRSGSRWTSAQGQIQVETFRLAEASLPALFEEEKKANRRQIESSDLKSDSFVISGTQGLKYFLVRAAARGSEVRGMSILYDQATEGTMGPVAHAMATAFTAFPDPNAPAPPGLRRAVEYGNAIVVDAGGDLIAPAHVTADCRTITVPPFGHAVRLAADQTGDLALIHLYGVRNLVPVQFGEDNDSGDLIVIGVADPLAQAGSAIATGSTAHLTARGIDPAPKPGFSGAAAVDTHGVLAGMVDVKPAVLAANAPAAPAAALVPAATIRAFLRAQGIVPDAAETEHAAAAQSVLRIICVRQ
jgi:hypothetical protein